VSKEQPAVQVFDCSQHLAGFGAALVFGPGESLEEEKLQKPFVEEVGAPLPGGRELVLKAIHVAVVDEAFLLQKVDEHQAIQENGCIPLAITFGGDSRDQTDKGEVLGTKLFVELLCDTRDIERVTKALGYFYHRDVAGGIEFSDLKNESAEFSQEKVAGLIDLEIVIAWIVPAIFSLHPIPEALGSLAVDEDEQVLVVEGGDFSVHGRAGFRGWDSSRGGGDFEDKYASELGDLAAREFFLADGECRGFYLSRL